VPGGTFTAVAAGFNYSVGLRTDGTLVAWGDNRYGQCDVPDGVYSAIDAGYFHTLAIRAVPEPSSLASLSLALLAAGAGVRWRRRR